MQRNLSFPFLVIVNYDPQKMKTSETPRHIVLKVEEDYRRRMRLEYPLQISSSMRLEYLSLQKISSKKLEYPVQSSTWAN